MTDEGVMPKTKKSSDALEKIAELSKCSLTPEPPSKKLKSEKSVAKKDSKKTTKKSKKTTAKVTISTGLNHRYHHRNKIGKKMKPIAIAVQITPIKGTLTPKSALAFQESFTEIEGFTPIKEITYSKNGTPLEVKTQHNRRLFRQGGNGIIHRFTDDPPVARTLMNETDFASHKKEVFITISTQLLQTVAKKILGNGGKRSPSQNQVMGGSATQYSHKAGVSLENNAEWGHLVAHRFLSDLSQHKGNLVAITDHANTEMIPVEDFVSMLAMSKLGNIEIKVTAFLIDDKHIASSLKYDVCVGKRTLSFTFDGQQKEKPDFATKKIMVNFCKILLNHKKLEGKISKTPLNVSLDLSSFFSKSANAVKSKKSAPKPKKCNIAK